MSLTTNPEGQVRATETIRTTLKAMKIGETGSYEVETWGRSTTTLAGAVERVMQIALANAK